MNFLRLFNPLVTTLASLASIVGLVVSIISNQYAVLIALVSIIISLVLILCGFYSILNKFLKHSYPDQYHRISTFVVFRCDDGINSEFESYRLIQCKIPVLTCIEYRYKWSGSTPPSLTSNNQIIEQHQPNSRKDEWDRATIKFKRPLMYNESTVVHVKTTNHDNDKTAKPWLECMISYPVEIIQFRVMLGYKKNSFNKKAIFERKKIDSDIDAGYDFIGNVDFDTKYKQYIYMCPNPEPGYKYRLRWEK